MDDTGILVVAVVFLALLIVLTGFFNIDTGELIRMDDYSVDSPYSKTLVFDNGTYVAGANDSSVDSDSSVNWAQVIASGVLAGGAGLALAFFIPAVGFSIPVLAGLGGVLFSLSTTDPAAVANVPILGALVGGFHYVSSALSSFWSLVMYDNVLMSQVPGGDFVRFLIFIPIGFLFLLLVIKIIRGN